MSNRKVSKVLPDQTELLRQLEALIIKDMDGISLSEAKKQAAEHQVSEMRGLAIRR